MDRDFLAMEISELKPNASVANCSRIQQTKRISSEGTNDDDDDDDDDDRNDDSSRRQDSRGVMVQLSQNKGFLS